MGRSLLNVPHDVLLDQVVELRDHLGVADALRRALAEVGLDGEELHRRLTDVVSVARTKQTDLVFAKMEVARVAEERDAWAEDVNAWIASMRIRLAAFRAPREVALAKLVRAALPRRGAERFHAAVLGVSQTLAAIDLHADALGVAGWCPPLRDAGAELVARGNQLADDLVRTTAHASDAAVILDHSRATLQDLIREVRAASSLARAHDARAVALPVEVLARYRPRRIRPGESGTATSESEGGTRERRGGDGESGGGTSESGGGTSESGGGTSESGGGTSESGGGTSESGGGTAQSSSVPPLHSLVPPLHSLVPPLRSLVPPLRSLVPGTRSLVPPLRSPVPPLDSPVPPLHSLAPAQPPVGPDDVTVVHTLTIVRTQGSS